MSMPFVKKTNEKLSPSPSHPHTPFIGRSGEVLFFVHHILTLEDPSHNIISISGQAGVGKSTLLAHLLEEAHTDPFRDYCLTAIVDEREATPASIMEKFAEQLHLGGD